MNSLASRCVPLVAAATCAALLLATPASAQCPPAWGLPADPPSWCDRASAGADGVPGTADDNPDCVANAADGTHAPCSQTVATQWLFREGNDYCANCPYAFYVVVDCSTSFHVPNFDVEAMRLSVTDMLTGAPVLLTVQNECAVLRDRGTPFFYCDGCDTTGSIFPKNAAVGPPVNKPAGSCTGNPAMGPLVMAEMPCLPYRVTDFSASWGVPIDADFDGDYDEDADGSVDNLEGPPCTSCGFPACPCQPSTNMNPVTEQQLIDVVLHGSPLLSGVYRVEILGGGLEWSMFSNCDGSDSPQFPIYTHCADAMAAWQPVPELALHENPGTAFFVEDDTSCPVSVLLGVTTCNRSRGASAISAPFQIELDSALPAVNGDNTAHPADLSCQGPLAPGECRTCYWSVPIDAVTSLAVLTVDAADAVAECSESLTNARCDAQGVRTQALGLCSGGNSDSDSDGLSDWRERNLGFNPRAADADSDGLTDAAELAQGSSPTTSDSDGDGVADATDRCPVTADPLQSDADGDGLGDACEPGVRDVLARLTKLPDARMKLEWEWVEGALGHDLAAGDLDALRATRAHDHAILECGLPLGFTGRLVDDPAGAGVSRYYVLSAVFPGPDEWGATSRGLALPPPSSLPACR